MEYFLFKLLSIFLIYFSTFTKQTNCECGTTGRNVPVNSAVKKDDYLIFGNIFDQESTIKTGDVMQCEVINTNSEGFTNNNTHVFTQNSVTYGSYVFYPASKNKKCFSFQVRTKYLPHILLSATPSVVYGQKLEVILEYNENSVIRTKDNKNAVIAPIKNIVNDQELRGFWIRWLDDYLLEVGRDTDNYPFLSYRLPEKLSVNFIGILSYTTTAEWILHADPQCGAYKITKKLEAETKCKVVTTNFDPIKHNILQKSQQHILNQIKKQHGIFKASKFRSKEILEAYQQLIGEYFRNANDNQNKIYTAEDNEIYCPLKSVTFDEITEEYFQFLEELQMELTMFQHLPEETNTPKDFELNRSGNCCCNILQN